MRIGPDQCRVTARDPVRPHQAKLIFDPQIAPFGVVQSRHRVGAVAHIAQRGIEQSLPAIGSHEQVQPRIDRGCAIRDGAAGDLSMTVPVADDQPFKPHPLF